MRLGKADPRPEPNRALALGRCRRGDGPPRAAFIPALCGIEFAVLPLQMMLPGMVLWNLSRTLSSWQAVILPQRADLSRALSPWKGA